MAAPMRYIFGREIFLHKICQNAGGGRSGGVSWSILSRTIYTNNGPNMNETAVQKQTSDYSVVSPEEMHRRVVRNVNEELAAQSHGRLFAVVSVAGKQKKITQDDLIIVEDVFPPTVGDRIRLEKVLLVGGKNFSIVGRPILEREQATVEAVVVEKTLDVPKPVSYYRPRRNFFRFKLAQPILTVLRINKIQLNSLKE